MHPGESLLVLGAAGGVRLAAVGLDHLMGARVIVSAASTEKLANCREHGPTRPSTTRARTLRPASATLPAASVPTSSTTRSAVPTPSPLCARRRGTVASFSSASRQAISRASGSTCPSCAGAAWSACSRDRSSSASQTGAGRSWPSWPVGGSRATSACTSGRRAGQAAARALPPAPFGQASNAMRELAERPAVGHVILTIDCSARRLVFRSVLLVMVLLVVT